jgi:hypothetical protein
MKIGMIFDGKKIDSDIKKRGEKFSPLFNLN